MEYFGNSNATRLVEVCKMRSSDVSRTIYNSGTTVTVKNAETVEKFLAEEGLLGKYLYKRWKEMGDSYYSCVLKDNYNYREEIETISYMDRVFYAEQQGDYTYYYTEVPRFTNDEVFYWKENKRYGVKECVLDRGPFQMFCILKEGDEVSVEVRYMKCENRHRNVVTIATIDIFDGTNEVIEEAIREWAADFLEDFTLARFQDVIRESSSNTYEQVEKRKKRKEKDRLEKKKEYNTKKDKNEDPTPKPKKKRGRPKKVA